MSVKEQAAFFFDKANNHAVSGEFTDAIGFYLKAIELDPSNSIYYYNCAHTLKKLHQIDRAIDFYQRSISLDPDNVMAINNLGNLLKDSRRYLDAIGMYQSAIRLDPNFSVAYNNLGNAWQDLGEQQNAMIAYRTAIELNQDYPDPNFNLGNLFANQNSISQAVDSYGRVFELNKEFPFVLGELLYNKLRICDWDGCTHLVNRLIEGLIHHKPVAYPFSIQPIIPSPELMLRCAQIFQSNFSYDRSLQATLSKYSSHTKIRLAYFSSDLFEHNVSNLLGEILRHHDRDTFEIYLFSFVAVKPDNRVLTLFDQVFDVSDKNDTEVVKLSRSVEVDIAVDLNGLTRHCRPGIFKMRAAPLQINYLGYCGTTACENMDYIVADCHLIPPEMQTFYTEKVLYLEAGCFPIPCIKPSELDNLGSRAHYQLPEQAIVFACFNNNYKITPEIFDSWLSILKTTPNSVLWLLAESDEVVSNLSQYAALQDIQGSRIIFAPIVDHQEHLKRMQHADIFLDTHPCGSHTTARDILYSGKPLITQSGKSFHSNIGASLLNAIGVPELVASNPNDYQKIAQSLATNASRRAVIAEKIGGMGYKGSLRDPQIFTKMFEQALKRVYSQDY